MSYFNKDFFINNRSKLKNSFMGTAPIVLTANGLLQQNSDNSFLFRQDSSFWYFTGIEVPGAILVMDKNKEYLIIPNRPKYSEVADGLIDIESLMDTSGISVVLDEIAGWKQLSSKLKKVKHVATISTNEIYSSELGLYLNPARYFLNQKIKDINPEIKFLDIREHISRLRVVKQPRELGVMKMSVDLTNKVLDHISKNLHKYHTENEIEAYILAQFKINNAKTAYPSIVASGKNACTLHYHLNNQMLQPSDLILLDVGASISNYAADITRTISISNTMTKRQRDVYAAVVDIQNFAISIMRPGQEFKTYEHEIEKMMGEKLRELGLIKTINHQNVRKYYPHSTSHFLGLDPHDAGNYLLPVSENMVITIEPGIYIPEENLGVRIEDDFIVTSKGAVNLRDYLPEV